VEGRRVKSARVFGREVRSENLVWLVAILVLVLAVAIAVPVINSRGREGEPNGNTAQEPSGRDEPTLDVYMGGKGYKLVGNGECADSSGNVYSKVVNQTVFAEDAGQEDDTTSCRLSCSRFHRLPGHVGLLVALGDFKMCGECAAYC